MIRIESQGLDTLAADLAKAQAEIGPASAKVTGMACLNIKKDVQKRWSGLAHLPHLPRAISYDVKTFGRFVVGEVGADHERLQGKLAWTQEYGTPTSAPNPAFRPASDKEQPAWETFLDKVAADAIERGAS
jgi:hypothetical protein